MQDNAIVKQIRLFTRLFKESLSVTLTELKSNKFRTFLSLLSVSFGIFTIVAILTAIDSLDKNIRKGFESLNSNMVTVQKFPMMPEDEDGNPATMGSEYRWWDYIKRPGITYADYKFLKENLTKHQNIVYTANLRGRASYNRNNLGYIDVNCCTEDYEKFINVTIAEGRQISSSEYNFGSLVAVIGSELANSLYEGEDPIGKSMKLNGNNLVIVGVLEKKGEGAVSVMDSDGAAFIPYNTGKSIFALRDPDGSIMITAKENCSNEELVDEVRNVLKNYRRIRPGEKVNFSVETTNMIGALIDQLKNSISSIGWIIAAFSLLIGGFSIANIMFVSVKERTKIIGIQKALGAKKYFIMTQFLIESVIIAISGALMGILLVALIVLLIPKDSSFEIYFSVGNVLVGILIAAVIGVLSGYLPARAAANLNPVDAINSK